MPARFCPDCHTVHFAAPCGLSWIQRMRSVRLDPRAVPTRRNGTYYDHEQIDAVFNGVPENERKERYMDATKGKGHVKRNHRGELVYAKTGEHAGEEALRGEVIYER